jgi:hypothetical protein
MRYQSISSQRRKPNSLAFVFTASAALVLGIAGCAGGDDESAAPAATAEVVTTTTSTTTTTTLPAIGTPFQMDTVLSVSGISEIVGQGTLALTVAEEDGQVKLSIDGAVPVVDGETCQFCVATLELGPGAVAAADALFSNRPSDGVSAEMSGNLIGPMFPEDATLFIVAGDEGAVLEKEGAGFRLVEGDAWLVTDRGLIDPGYDAAAAPTTTAATTAASLPTYDEVVASYPSDVAFCFTEATVVAAEPGEPWTVELAGGTIVFAGGEAEFPCWGMQLVTQVPLQIDGSDLPAGSILAVSADSDPAAFAPVTLEGAPLIAEAGDFLMLIGSNEIVWSPPDGVVLVAVAP